MARIMIDGFENGDDAFSIWTNTNAPVLSTGGKTGTYCLRVYNYQYIQKSLGDLTEFFIAFDYKPSSATQANFINFYSGGTQIAYLRWNSLNSAAIYGGATNLGSTSPQTVIYGEWNHLQIRYVPDPTNGIFQVKFNDVLDFDFTGDTVAGSETTVTEVRLTSHHSGLYNYFDNVVMDDANWPGVSRIYALFPDGAGNSTDWTPSAGNNYECVDEVPASDSDYVETNASDDVDTYSMDDAPSVYAVKAVQVQARVQKTGTPTPQNLALVVRPPTGGTDYAGSDQAVPSAWVSLYELWEINPYTSSPWTESEVNGMEAGIKARA